MPAIAAPIAGAVVGGLLNKSQSSGGTQTTQSQPWSEAQPWMKSNIATGQGLQNYYTANPMSAGQQRAYGNVGATNDYLRSQIPGLLNTVNNQGYFNRANPSARPMAYQFGPQNSGIGIGPQYNAQPQQQMTGNGMSAAQYAQAAQDDYIRRLLAQQSAGASLPFENYNNGAGPGDSGSDGSTDGDGGGTSAGDGGW